MPHRSSSKSVLIPSHRASATSSRITNNEITMTWHRQWLSRLVLAASSFFVHPMSLHAQQALTLRELIDSVRVSLPSIRAAESRVRAAAGSRTTAALPGNPVLSYQVDQTPFPGRSALPPDITRETMTTATIPLEFLYQRGPKLARANADVRAAKADAIATRQRAALDAANAFYGAALAQVRAETARELAGWLDTLVSYNRARVEEGAAAEADLIRSTVEHDRILAELAVREADLARAHAGLAAFISSESQAVLRPVTFSLQPLPIPSSLNAAARPDVQAARERVASARAGVMSERSMLFRQLGATIGTMQTMGTTSMIAGISLPLPVFDTNRGEVLRAAAQRDAAQFELDGQERVARAELHGATDAANVLMTRMRQLAIVDSTGFLARANESRRITLGAYREGAVPLFQVIDAARAWADARSTYFETLFAQHESVLMLIAANGADLFSAIAEMPTLGVSAR
jgi:cobalt-zinc-cadmium efflux system outer membrane protein